MTNKYKNNVKILKNKSKIEVKNKKTIKIK